MEPRLNKQDDIAGTFSCAQDEIDLMEILQVLARQKKIILATAAVFLLVAFLYTLFCSPLYEIKIQVKSGLKGWPKEDIVSWLKEKQYLNLFPEPDRKEERKIRSVRYKQERRGQIVTIYMYWPNPKEGREFLQDLTHRWMDYYLNRFPDEGIMLARREIEQKIDELEQQLKSLDKINMIQLENRIAEKTKLIGLKKTDIETIKREIDGQKGLLRYLENTAERVMMNTKALMKARDDLIINGKQQDLSMLFLLNSIQQNISYADQVKGHMVEIQSDIYQEQNQINALKNEIEEIKNAISEMKLQKAVELKGKKLFLEKQIKDFRYQLAHVGPIKVLGPATSTLDPVKPQKILIWSIALIGGLFVGIFLAFFKSMLQEQEDSENAR